MKTARIHASLTTKLSLVVTAAVILALVVLGGYFDSFLQKNFLENAQQRMEHGHKRLAYNLNSIETGLRDGIAFLQFDESMRASVGLINNYQDKRNYNTYLIDEEKKTIALMLLDQVKLSFNDAISIYDQNMELIAYVDKDANNFHLHYLSFEGGARKLFGRHESDLDYVQEGISPESAAMLELGTRTGEPHKPGVTWITYHRVGDSIVIKAHLDIRDETSDRAVAYVELSKTLDQTYFLKLSADLDIKLEHTFDTQYADQAAPLGRGLLIGMPNIRQTDNEFVSAMKRDSESGPVYFIARMDKNALNAILNQNRMGFLLFLFIVAAITLLLMRLLINRSLARPVDAVMEQILKIEQQDYSPSRELATGDELQAISKSISQLASAVQEREASLRESRNVLSREIAEREQAERQIRKLSQAVEQSSVTVVITDIAGNIEYVNRKFIESTGYSFKEVAGRNSRFLKSGHTPPEEYEVLWKTISSGQEWRGEFHNKRKDGTLFWEAASISPIKAPDGKIINYLAIKEDVTERKKTEGDLLKAKEAAEFANHAKSNFLANMSHELRTPLNAIIGFSQMLSEQTFGPLGSEQNREYVRLIGDSGLHLLGIISDILDLSKIEAGEENIVEEEIPVPDLVGECVSMLQERFARDALELTVEIPQNLPALYGDRMRIKQVLLNLMSNAIKFTPKEGSVRVSGQVDADGAISLKIADTGVGIAAENIARVTNPFEQLEEATSRSKEGTGLGLALSKRLVDLHGGVLHIESEVGKGTTVTVSFPPERSHRPSSAA